MIGMAKRLSLVAFACIALIGACCGASLSDPSPTPSVQTPPPDVVAPSPTPLPLLVNGQIIDLERGYVVFSSGDAFKLSPQATITDDATGTVPSYALDPGVYAVATLDSQSGQVVALRTSLRPLAQGTPAAQIPRRYVVVASSPKPNPDLAPPAVAYTKGFSATVGVTIVVSVPANTPLGDDVYMSTDTSGWNPQAVKMQRLDGLHFQIEMELQRGTEIHFLFTRGTWNTVERDRAGLQRQARDLLVPGGDVRVINVTVYRWADLP